LNSWLITLRELATKSAAEQERGTRAGLLRSATVRGLPAARHTLLRCFELASSRDPEAAAHGLIFLRVTVKNYTHLLFTLASSAEHEQKLSGRSAWLPYFRQGSTPAYLGQELAWLTRFFQAAAGEGFSLDAARPFMHEGRAFLAAGNTHVAIGI